MYTLKPEHEARFSEWRDKWIENAFATGRLGEAERKEVIEHAKGLYISAGLTPPPDYRIVIVPSPFVGRFAAGYAAGIWWMRENPGKLGNYFLPRCSAPSVR